MERSELKKEMLFPVLEGLLWEHFSNVIDLDTLIEKSITPLIGEITEEEWWKISKISGEAEREVMSVECDEDGATTEQNAEMDKIVHNCMCDIFDILIKY